MDSNMSLFFRQQILDNCRLLFPTEPGLTIVTSPTGDYVVSLLAPTHPKILLDAHAGLPDLHNLYTKTQQRVAWVLAAMKMSVPRRSSTANKHNRNSNNNNNNNNNNTTNPNTDTDDDKNLTPNTTTTFTPTSSTPLLPPAFPPSLLPLTRTPTRCMLSPGGKSGCCAQERERRWKAEKRVHTLEGRIAVARRELEEQINALPGRGAVPESEIMSGLGDIGTLLEEPSESPQLWSGVVNQEEEGGGEGNSREMGRGARKSAREVVAQWVIADDFAWDCRQRPGERAKQDRVGGKGKVREEGGEEDELREEARFEMMEYP